MNVSDRIATALVLLACVSLAAPAHGQRPGGIIRDGTPPDLGLLYTGDVIGYLDPCG